MNDTHGHATGDHVLVEVGRRIRMVVRPDDVVGRLGGDEFVVILPGAGSIDMRAITPRIDKAVNRSLSCGPIAYEVSRHVEDDAEVFATAIATEGIKTIREARAEAARCAFSLRLCAEEALRFTSEASAFRQYPGPPGRSESG